MFLHQGIKHIRPLAAAGIVAYYSKHKFKKEAVQCEFRRPSLCQEIDAKRKEHLEHPAYQRHFWFDFSFLPSLKKQLADAECTTNDDWGDVGNIIKEKTNNAQSPEEKSAWQAFADILPTFSEFFTNMSANDTAKSFLGLGYIALVWSPGFRYPQDTTDINQEDIHSASKKVILLSNF